MLFSKTCEYGLQAIILIAHTDEKISLTDISEAQDLPSHYLSKILQLLVKAKLLKSTKGPNGGFELNKPASQIRFSDVIDAIDGIDTLDKCGLGLRACDDKNPCAIHKEYHPYKTGLLNLFYSKTLEKVVDDINEGKCIMLF